MYFKNFLVVFVLIQVAAASSSGFVFQKFDRGSLELSGVAEVRDDGLLRLTNAAPSQFGQAFYSVPFGFKNSSNGSVSSFSTTCVLAIAPDLGNGMALVLAPSKKFIMGQGLGLFNLSNNGSSSNHIVAVELRTFQNQEVDDIDDNHVGIAINSLTSAISGHAGYVSIGSSESRHVDLASGERIQLWVEYDGTKHQLNVTLSPIHLSKPKVPLLSMDIDLSPIIVEQMYVGFTSATGQQVSSLYVLGWSFQIEGKAQDLDLDKLPSLPGLGKSRKKQVILAVVLPLTGVLLVAVTISAMVFLAFRNKRAVVPDISEDWEVQFGSHRFPYEDLLVATGGFDEKELLGQGGFGQVFRGELPGSKVQVAVKRISHQSHQGTKEFISEICTIGRLRHPNLVKVLGYSRVNNELLLVYEYMPNGSLDKFLHNKPEVTLDWDQRFRIIKDVASALAFLHDEWTEVIIHRDIKPSNVLLDGDLNGKLGDFGLAICSNIAQGPQTTHIAGTFGYMAPELPKTGMPSTSTDVYAFGAFCLEVVCGRRPIKSQASADEVHLADWVFKCWKEGDLLKTIDSTLGKDIKVGEINLVMKLGLLCTHKVAAVRPRMPEIILYLKEQASLPESLDAILQEYAKEPGDYSAARANDSTAIMTVTESFLSRGR
ncbi:Protein kinase domain - like 10 [Theobroma cacao]|uniref:non-specific serine/threonine protein kinase n=1 Tax=Theobroma cacao TaxID=3641 RepID=A0A061EYV7_THECC|nr:Concanavalin A-like lectin protein kinase family protein, putative [Theobroma cacao]WRX23450.1 Protein kinase domain - like 10 [Theobroma cacao]